MLLDATITTMLEDTQDNRLVAFFDIDNTLYSANHKIAEAIGARIRAYLLSLGLSGDEASELHSQYYRQYGLTVRGLQRHHGVDPIDFDEKCDGSLPLEEMLKPNPHVRQLLQDIDRSKCRVWAFTNAYRTHAERVLKILGLRDQMEGVVFCDYSEKDFACKPEPAFYLQAMQRAGVSDPRKCLFVDDSFSNIEGAKNVGWIRSVHFREVEPEIIEESEVKRIAKDQEKLLDGDEVNDLQELREVWPDIFVQAEY